MNKDQFPADSTFSGYAPTNKTKPLAATRKWTICMLALLAPLATLSIADAPDFGNRIINADREPHNWLSHGRS
ncbi:MAG: hypothetical protein M0Q95_21445, partial [Porticoccaceae bacterium]|nr:hypothetical protein [Porticoccaceae bacterium]